MKIFEYRGFWLENLVLAERETPRPAGREVVVKFRAASLNYRDVLFCKGVYKPDAIFPVIPFCDGAGEVTAIGSQVTRWKIGDRVCPIFMPGWLDGPITREKARTAIGGGDLDGVLRESGAFHEEGLLGHPDHLSFEEAATLPAPR